MQAIKSTRAIGLMCGTSRDGMDLADASFSYDGHKWQFHIHGSRFFELDRNMHRLLTQIETFPTIDALIADRNVGVFFAQRVKEYLAEAQCSPDIVSSHGITIFHQPDRKITWQIGNGAVLAAELALPVICDFRSGDVALGGQGAPLVPKGDLELFGNYNACLNLGGFSNITLLKGGEVLAFDISPCNIVLNALAERVGNPYDEGGKLAKSGTLIPDLFSDLQEVSYYQLPPPKSLGKEWVRENISPILEKYPTEPVENLIHTFTVHIAAQIANAAQNVETCLVTGGGAHNHFLLDTLAKLSSTQWVVPSDEIINYKEALVFAFLGVLRWHNLPNTIPSATGANRAISAGAVYLP